MRRLLLTALLAAPLTMPLTSTPLHADEPVVTELGDGIYAVLQPEPLRFNDSNSVLIVNERDVIVVDTQASLAATRRVLAALRERTELPISYVIHTHWHGDHVQGDSVYREAYPDVRFVGHRTHRDDIPGRATTQLREDIDNLATGIADARKLLAAGVDREGQTIDEPTRERYEQQVGAAEERLEAMRTIPLPLPAPDVTFDERMTLHRPGRTIELIHAGAHTRGDVILHLPDDGLLLTGDVLDDLPFGGHGYPAVWLSTLEELAGLEFARIVPGHGSIRSGRDHLHTVRDMFRAIVDGARASAKAGHDLERTVESIDLEKFRAALAGEDALASRMFDAFIPPTIERAWLEARGEPGGE